MPVAPDILTVAVTETLETMAFSAVAPLQEETLLPEEGVVVEIHFKGPLCGTLQLWGGKELGRNLAECIGCLDETDEQSAWDAWQEICNVVCGLVLPRLASSAADVFDITVPRIICDATLPSWDAFTARSEVAVFDVEGHALAAHLDMKSGSED